MADKKFLAVKNWKKYQSGKGKLRWIKLEVDLEDDSDFKKLTMFQRGLLMSLWRLRGRTARNIPDDSTDIACGLQVISTERPCLPHAISTLVARGFLIPTNQEHDSIDKSREEEKREEQTTQKPTPSTIPVPGRRAEILAPEGTDECVEVIQRAWKKPCGQAGMVACVEAFEYESNRKHMDWLEAARYVRDKTVIVADLMADWPPGDFKFIPKLTDFMRQQQYENEPATWGRSNDSTTNGRQHVGPSATEILRARLADSGVPRPAPNAGNAGLPARIKGAGSD